jgi:hypothetical protein
MAENPDEAALKALEVFVGEWEIETSFDLDPSLGPARATFEWALDGKFLLQRADVPHPFPDLFAVIGTDPETGAYTQHYFDSRGVVRVYEMELTEKTWTLLRTKPDFTPLTPFPQRYVGNFEDGGNRISGRWEKAPAGDWELDFELSYLRA